MGQKQRRRRAVSPVTKITLSIDPITDAVVKRLQDKEGLSYSAALCNLAIYAARQDPDLAEVIKGVVEAEVQARLETEGWHPGLSQTLARELLTGQKEPSEVELKERPG